MPPAALFLAPPVEKFLRAHGRVGVSPGDDVGRQ